MTVINRWARREADGTAAVRVSHEIAPTGGPALHLGVVVGGDVEWVHFRQQFDELHKVSAA